MKKTILCSNIWLTLTYVIGTVFIYACSLVPTLPPLSPTAMKAPFTAMPPSPQPITEMPSIPTFVSEVIITPEYDQGYIVNPGMGWQYDGSFIDTSGFFFETVAYANRLDITWSNLNPAEDVYNWAPLEQQLSLAVSDGKQFSFRVATMGGEIYGGHRVPEWVLQKGAIIFSSGEPDYSNCVYQQEWGKFVSALLQRYDGNPDIAFIDISGYGNFNEWSWQDQTEWDWLWDSHYKNSTATPSSFSTLDGQARRRLADMFLGGAYDLHQCRTETGSVQTISYSYLGAQTTQLVMPYAGIIQATQYVFTKRKDVGFRYDCLGRDIDLPIQELSQIWRSAPVVYELCSSDEFNVSIAQNFVEQTHPVLIHNNGYTKDSDNLLALMLPVGYRFFLKEVRLLPIVKAGEEMQISMVWQNHGVAIPYAKMGQMLQLYVYLIDPVTDETVLAYPVSVDPASWLPADTFSSLDVPEYWLNVSFPIPVSVCAGEYILALSIIDRSSNQPIQLAMTGLRGDGKYPLAVMQVISK